MDKTSLISNFGFGIADFRLGWVDLSGYDGKIRLFFGL